MSENEEREAHHRASAARAANRAAVVMDGFTGGHDDTAYISACAELGTALTALAQYHSDELAREYHRNQQGEIFEARVRAEVERRCSIAQDLA